MLGITTYLDESLDERSERVLCLSGFLATAADWSALCERWEAALRENGLPDFHMVDCEHGNGAFARRSPQERGALQRRFLGIITRADSGLLGTGCAVKLMPYNRRRSRIRALRTLPPGLPASGDLSHPFFVAFQHCLEWFGEHPSVRSLPQGEQISFVMDRSPLAGRAKYLCARMQRAESVPYRSRLGECRDASRKDELPLQAADVIAYESRRHFEEAVLGRKPERWQFMEIKKVAGEFRMFDRRAVRKLLAVLEKQTGRTPRGPDRQTRFSAGDREQPA